MTIDDAEHYDDEQRAEIIARYPSWERGARIRGEPSLGTGRVFPIDDSEITVSPFALPDTFTRLGALDFGGSGQDGHPTAAVELWHDPDMDRVFIAKEYRKKGQTTLFVAAAVKPWGEDMPWAWPRDGLKSIETTSHRASEALKDIYAKHGLKMLPEYAQFEAEDAGKAGSVSVEAGLMVMYEYMLTDRFKVFSTCTLWLEEFRQYHREDGVIVKKHDDLMDATRYAFVMRRFAERSIQRKWGRVEQTGIV